MKMTSIAPLHKEAVEQLNAEPKGSQLLQKPDNLKGLLQQKERELTKLNALHAMLKDARYESLSGFIFREDNQANLSSHESFTQALDNTLHPKRS